MIGAALFVAGLLLTSDPDLLYRTVLAVMCRL